VNDDELTQAWEVLARDATETFKHLTVIASLKMTLQVTNTKR